MKRGRIAFFAATLFAPLLVHAFDLQGHRGARGLAPENTLAAFAVALSLGVDTLELDTAVTKDGIVVVTHDPRLNPDITRGPDGRYLNPPTRAVRELTLDDLLHFDVGRIKPGSEYSYRFPDQKRADRVRIPTLAQVFKLAKSAGNAAVRFNIEIKSSPEKPAETLAPDAFAKALLAVIEAEGMMDRVVIQSFDWRGLKAVQQFSPRIPTSYLSVQQSSLNNIAPEWNAGMLLREHGSIPKMVKAAGGAIWSPNFSELNQGLLKEAQGLGLKVLPWTVNAREDMERLIDWGVDGLITDRPDFLREVMAAKRLPLPAPTPVNP